MVSQEIKNRDMEWIKMLEEKGFVKKGTSKLGWDLINKIIVEDLEV